MAPAVETSAGVLVDEPGGAAVEGLAVVVPGAEDAEVLMMLAEDATAEETATLEEMTGGTPDSAGGAGGAAVAVSTGGPLRGADAVDSTEVTGGAGGGASYDGTTGV